MSIIVSRGVHHFLLSFQPYLISLGLLRPDGAVAGACFALDSLQLRPWDVRVGHGGAFRIDALRAVLGGATEGAGGRHGCSGGMLVPDREFRESSYYILSLRSSLFTAPGLGYAKAQGPILARVAAWCLPEARWQERRSLLAQHHRCPGKFVARPPLTLNLRPTRHHR